MKAIKIVLVSLLTLNLVSCSKDEVLPIEKLPFAENNRIYLFAENGYYQSTKSNEVFEIIKDSGDITVVGNNLYLEFKFEPVSSGKYYSDNDELRLTEQDVLRVDYENSDINLDLKKL